MSINKITKISAAIACVLTMSAHAGSVQSASTMSAGMTGNDINQVLSLTGNSLMREVKSLNLGIGLTKIRFQQEYKGVPVFGYNLTGTQTPMGLYIDVTGKFMNLNEHDISVVPGVSSTSAFSSALSSDNTTKASIYNQENDMFIYMVKDKPVLAHRVSYVIPSDSGDTPSRPVHFIDAQTGETLYSYENIQHAEVATGPGGNTKTGEYEYGTDFGFNDVSVSGNTYTMSNANVKTVNLNHGTSGSTAYSFTGPRNTVKSINGAYSPLNDAHFFGGVVFDMFNDYTGQAPLTFQLTMRVHY
ncbi:MAG: hemagglutinin, partial [Alteromonadaceae bacterium]|nr:hemagglutinin [Alteromonadaceae bacterium]